jgi:hypothetical protein
LTRPARTARTIADDSITAQKSLDQHTVPGNSRKGVEELAFHNDSLSIASA